MDSKKPGTKSELLDLSLQMQAAYDRMLEIADEYPELMVYSKDTDGKSGFGEAFSPFMEQFGKRLDYFRRQVGKYGDLMPKRGKKSGNKRTRS
jgi:hypothetical protein